MGSQGTRLLVKVAQLYHLQGLSQDQIGRQLGVSRSKVSRMLKEARERGLVEISIHYPSRFSLELERRLEAELGLREAVVVNIGGASIQALSSVAGAASDYLMRVLQPADVLGVSGGETVALTAQVIPAVAIGAVTVVQLGAALAYLGGEGASSAEVALQVAQKLGSMDRLVLIPIPSLLDTEAIRDALLRDTGVRRALALLASCTVALVGIGALDSAACRAGEKVSSRSAEIDVLDTSRRRLRRHQPAVTPAELSEFHDVGAVGEICARFFDVQGRPCVTSLDRRMVAPDLEQVRSVPLVIGVACGKQKAAAIVGAVRGGYVKALVTDDVTAAEVLALAGSTAAGPRDGTDGRTSDDRRGSEQTRDLRSERAPMTDRRIGDSGALGQAPLAHGRRGPSTRGR